jgi:hypothetical protein
MLQLVEEVVDYSSRPMACADSLVAKLGGITKYIQKVM